MALTIRDITEQITELQGYIKIQSIQNDNTIVHYVGEGLYNLKDEILDSEITYIYPYHTGMEPALCIEIKEEEE